MTVSAHVAVARARHTLARTPAHAADRLARAVGEMAPERLDQLMRTPMRRVVLDAIFWQMPKFLDRRRAAKVDAAVRWCITGRGDGSADTYHLEFSDGRCRALRGEGELAPRVTITLDGAEFLRLATGNGDALQAYFSGRLALGGDIMFAAKLASLFRVPKGRR